MGNGKQKRLKIAYVLTWDWAANDGVVRKVRMQVRAWETLGCEVVLFCVTPNPVSEEDALKGRFFLRPGEAGSSNLLGKLLQGRKVYAQLVEEVGRFQPDLVYMRAQYYKSQLGKLMARFPTVVELNSLDVVETRLNLRSYGVYGVATYIYNTLTRGRTFSAARALVAVTGDILRHPSFARFRKPGLVVPNAILLEDYQVLDRVGSEDRPSLVFAGSGGRKPPDQHWHGVDKIIALAERTQDSLDFHLVGNDIARGLRIPANVKMYGWLEPAELNEVYEKTDVAIGSLAMHRAGMNEASVLKVREYLAHGLPVILGYPDTAFVGRALPEWVLQLENHGDNVLPQADKVVGFAREMRGRRVAHEESHEYVDVTAYERKKLAFFEEVLERA